MDSQIGLLARMIAKRPLSYLPSNTEQIPKEYAEVVTLRNIKELATISPMVVDEEEETAQAPKESTFPEEEELNDIYDTLKYEDALRVTFAAFRLRGMAKDWWLRASKARTLKNQPWTWNDFQEESKKEYIPRWVLAVEAAMRTEMVDQAVIQRKKAIGSTATPYKRPGQGP
ncbi:hypothetical protein M9H77_02754 [Catharanthus roseus]|uniref:Uncharacterized protein n=1 Tax=Catharanthus roseus TaxID=4058 RepID=A0ACC0C9C6_CATRO|nr:hypothetical protein M9H77_02754 [Catharanthus roseus]